MSEKFATPMLAAKPKTQADYDKITYPKLGSPKLDGVRAVVRSLQEAGARLAEAGQALQQGGQRRDRQDGRHRERAPRH